MGYLRRIAARARRRLGRAVHDAGGATRSDVRALEKAIQRLRDELANTTAATQAGLDHLTETLNHLGRGHTDVLNRLAYVDTMLAIESFSRFIAQATLRAEPLVSVVLPTYRRPDRLRRAITSVLAQRYANWELIVVDDGSDDYDPDALTAQFRDARIRCLRVEHGGVGAARNAGLEAAGGKIITYLDDDNVMDPRWLYAVVWAFEQHADIDLLYGAFVIDDVHRVRGPASGEMPRTFLHAWDRKALEQANLADIGAVAHRSGLPGARFDETLRQMADWDLLLRLTEHRDPLVLPAVACYYATDAPDRLSLGPTHAADRATVMAKTAGTRR